jgi:serine protease Do
MKKMLQYPSRCAAILAVALITSYVSADENTPFSRRNPVVEAVAKAKTGVVAVRVPRQGEKDTVGTGFIVDEGGLIVTNRHVTGGKKYVKIRLHDGTDLIGEVTATDAKCDLAIVQISTDKKLKALPLGPTADLMQAETVIAIGNPFGYEGTVSVGIISALNREITMPNDVTITGLIQTTAAINPGNSGGPLLNVNGEVIGVNVALRDGAQNIAFAINAGTVKSFLNQHRSAKRVAGIDHGLNVEEKILAEVGDRQRVVVKNASHADLKTGDEIMTVGDRKVISAFDMERALWHKKPGEQVNVRVMRQGHEMTVTVTLGASQGAGQVAAVPAGTSEANSQGATATVRSANQR